MNIMSIIRAILVCVLLFSDMVISASVTAAQMQQHTSSENVKARAQKIADYFSQIRTMTGKFVQFGPRGDMTQGTFYLERPGKVRFVYKDSPIRVISDGKSVVINNKKLDTWDLYQLQQTPMSVLLSDRIDLSNNHLVELKEAPGAVTVVITDNKTGKSKIRMIFDPGTHELRQWTMIDKQNLETTVQLVTSQTGVRFADGMFDIDYQRISMKRKRK